MAPLPLGRLIAQVIVPIVAVLARALPAAYNQALQNARRGGGAQAAMSLTKKLSKQEALQILNLRETEATAEAVQKQFDKYFAANAVERGGSFYLQSKVYRAKQLMDEYLADKENEASESSNEEVDEKQGQDKKSS